MDIFRVIIERQIIFTFKRPHFVTPSSTALPGDATECTAEHEAVRVIAD